jgi:shikimate dehydrogenase
MSHYLKLALLGHPVSHTVSPVLQTAALQFAGIEGEYVLFDIEPEFLDEGLKKMLASGVNGFNVTIPHKQTVYRMMDSTTKEAELTRAVNTVKVENDGKLVGHNTDIIGFRLALTEAMADEQIAEASFSSPKTALIIGAGGAAKAVVVALSQLGFKNIKIKGRSPDKVHSFISDMQTNLTGANVTNSAATKLSLQAESPERGKQSNYAEPDLIVNASPIGLKYETAPEWLAQLISELNDQCLCFDLVYGKNGNVPTFTKLASQRGLKAIDGLPMLIHQARYAFHFWTGIMVPSRVMYEALALH